MSVQSGPTFKRYAANGIATVYAIPFLLIEAEDLQITLDGVLVTSGFTLTGVGNPTSTCTFDVAPLGDLLFQLVIPFQRLDDYQENGDFLASTVNNDFDRLWQAVKELRRDDGRALTVDPLEPEGIPPLPVKAIRLEKMLAFDALGNPIPSNLTLDQLEEQPALAMDSASAAAAAATAASTAAAAASSSESASAASALLAQKWAENPEDTPVTPGSYSALHWAIKAAASRTGLNSRVTALENIGKPFTKEYVSSEQTITVGGLLTLTHGLGVAPKLVTGRLVCKIAEHGYTVGDVVEVKLSNASSSATDSHGAQAKSDATNVLIRYGVNPFFIGRWSDGANAQITPANWRLIVRAWA